MKRPPPGEAKHSPRRLNLLPPSRGWPNFSTHVGPRIPRERLAKASSKFAVVEPWKVFPFFGGLGFFWGPRLPAARSNHPRASSWDCACG